MDKYYTGPLYEIDESGNSVKRQIVSGGNGALF